MNLLPISRAVLPALNHFIFCGISDYLEDFVARIDAPRLHSLRTFYLGFDQVVDFEVHQFSEFINCSENLKKTLPRSCEVKIYDYFNVGFSIGSGICVGVIYRRIDQQTSQITHVLGWISHAGQIIRTRGHGGYRTAATPPPILLRADTVRI